MAQFKCTYRCKTLDDPPRDIGYAIISESPCTSDHHPPPSVKLTACVLDSSEQLPEDPLSKKLAHTGLGTGVGVILVYVIAGSTPPGWLAIGVGAVVGGFLGWWS